MSPSHRSLAYHWAKAFLRRRSPSWIPVYLVGVSVLAGSVWFFQVRSTSLLFVVVLTLLAAADSWLAQGLREIFDEQERLLEETRAGKNAAPTESTATTSSRARDPRRL